MEEQYGCSFPIALVGCKSGMRMARLMDKDKGYYIVMMPPLALPSYNTEDTARKVNDRTAKWIGKDTPLSCQAYFAQGSDSGFWQPGWVPSTFDMIADDWVIFE